MCKIFFTDFNIFRFLTKFGILLGKLDTEKLSMKPSGLIIPSIIFTNISLPSEIYRVFLLKTHRN